MRDDARRGRMGRTEGKRDRREHRGEPKGGAKAVSVGDKVEREHQGRIKKERLGLGLKGRAKVESMGQEVKEDHRGRVKSEYMEGEKRKRTGQEQSLKAERESRGDEDSRFAA
jgi:hypothetical protein